MDQYKDLEDAELIRKYCDGDLNAFSVLVDRYKSPLFGFIKRFTNNHEAAEDIFQETFLRVVKHFPKYNEDGRFKGWLFSIANNLCINYAKSKKNKNKYYSDVLKEDEEIFTLNDFPDSDPLPDKILESKESSILIEKALLALTEEQKEVFLLRMHGDLPFSEIAERLNRPMNTVLGQMRTAIIKIKKYLIEYDEK
jgi:RNA polymerase sigma-70 factor, ECF subfamily